MTTEARRRVHAQSAALHTQGQTPAGEGAQGATIVVTMLAGAGGLQATMDGRYGR